MSFVSVSIGLSKVFERDEKRSKLSVTMALTHTERAERRKRIAEACRNGKSADEVAFDEGVALRLVFDACGIYDVRYRRRTLPQVKRQSTQTIELAFAIVKALRETDTSLRAIGDSFGVTHQWVSQIETMAMEAGLLAPRKEKR